MAQISLRVDDDVKRNAERTLTDIGLSMSTAINIFLKKVARENREKRELKSSLFLRFHRGGYYDTPLWVLCAL